MLRVIEIVPIAPFVLRCKFNNLVVKSLEIKSIIENHKHINGVESLLNEEIFNNAGIGEFGEIVWRKIVRGSYNGVETLWDYDISPEYVYENG